MKKRKDTTYSYEITTHRIEKNLSESGVTISDTKSRLIYRDFMKDRQYLGVFTSSLGVFLSFLISLLTTSFKDVFGIEGSSSVIEAIFIIICFFSGVLTIVFMILYFINRKKYNEEAFIRDLHNKEKY